MNIWITLIIAGLITYLIRLSFIALLGRVQMPVGLVRALRFVPTAVLSAIIFPELLITNGQFNLSPGNFRLVAGLVAVLVAWRTRNSILTILVGMLTLWLLQAIF